MNRLFEIANELGKIARKRFDLRQLIQLENDAYTKHEREMIPVGGWPGSNADQRKAAELTAKAADEVLTAIANGRQRHEDELGLTEARREALLAERDAWQWTIRDLEQFHAGGVSIFDRMRIYQEHCEVEMEHASVDDQRGRI